MRSVRSTGFQNCLLKIPSFEKKPISQNSNFLNPVS